MSLRNYFYYRDKKRCIQKEQNKIGSHTDKNNNQLELDSEITCNTSHSSSPSDHFGNPAGEEQDPDSNSMRTWGRYHYLSASFFNVECLS